MESKETQGVRALLLSAKFFLEKDILLHKWPSAQESVSSSVFSVWVSYANDQCLHNLLAIKTIKSSNAKIVKHFSNSFGINQLQMSHHYVLGTPGSS